ncbi:MAG: hypothetical protein OXC46_12220 [Thaumarchaeota archaeon]|nr:hypothetical protein [Nitrososphaerota archaeon]
MKVCSIFAVLYVVGGILFLSWVHSDPDEEWKIRFVCLTGLEPYSLHNYMSYNNGTHTITMYSCDWIANTDLKHPSDERDEIIKMSCLELTERHDSGRPYHNNENRGLAEFRISTCELTKDLELDKKQP